MRNNENHPSGDPRSVLFVCTGNIFRSVTAEYALKARLGAGTSYVVSSAGIDVRAQSMHEWVLARLREKGADPISHVRRQLTEELVKASDLVIAMGRNHQAFIREEYGQAFPCLIRSVLASTSRFWICMKRYRIGKLTLSGLAPMCVR